VRESAGALSPGNGDDRVWLTFDPNDAAILATGKPHVATPPEPTTAGSR
jgi:putative spermidine/putrescine transport system ATP-binding protein